MVKQKPREYCPDKAFVRLIEAIRDQLIPDTLYVMYRCGHCCCTFEEDKNRKNRTKWKPTLIKGKPSRANRVSCWCGLDTEQEVKFKLCSICKKIEYMHPQTNKPNAPCAECAEIQHTSRSSKKKRYFQQNREIERPLGVIVVEPLCVYRGDCLEFTFQYGDNPNNMLCCNNCPKKTIAGKDL